MNGGRLAICMHRILALFLVLALVPPAVGQEPNQPIISELYPDPDSGREFIELYNPGNADVNLAGWRVEDAVGNGYTFQQSIAAGAYLVIWSGGEADALGPAMSGTAVWNNGGDTAYLLDAAGSVVQQFAYGSAEQPAPTKGESIQWAGSSWTHATPSPGGGTGQQVGTATATVDDVPPTLEFLETPPRLRPNEAGQVRIAVSDANGDDVTWTLSHGETVLHSGNSGQHDVLVSFAQVGDVQLTLHGEDPGGNMASITALIQVAENQLRVELPPEGIRFPSLPPGGGPVDAVAPFQIVNDGSATQAPWFDLSDLKGPATIPVVGYVSIGTKQQGAAEWSWTPYDSPLTALPSIAPGATVDVMLRLLHLPEPLAAGDYHTSFTVVA